MSSPLIGSLSVSISLASSASQPPAKRPRLFAPLLEPDLAESLSQDEDRGLPVDWEGRFGLFRPDVVAEVVRMCSSVLGEDEHALVVTWSVLTRFMYRVQVETKQRGSNCAFLPVVTQTQLRCLAFLAMSFAVDCVSSLEQEDQLGSLNQWAALYSLIEAGGDYMEADLKFRSSVSRQPLPTNASAEARQIADFLDGKHKFASVLDWRVRAPTCWEFLTVFTERLRASVKCGSGLQVETVTQTAFEYLLSCSLVLYETRPPSVVAAVALSLAMRSSRCGAAGAAREQQQIENVPRPSVSTSAHEDGLETIWGGEVERVVLAKQIVEEETSAIEQVQKETQELVRSHCRGLLARMYVAWRTT